MSTTEIACKPLADRVIILPHTAESMTGGGIIIPEAYQQQSYRGIVQNVGPGRTLDNGSVVQPQLTPGDEVLYARYAGVEILVEGQTCVIMRESDVLAIL